MSENEQAVGLRGPYLYPTVTNRYFVAEGYRPPGEVGTDWDPQRPPAGLRSQFTVTAWGNAFKRLQDMHPGKRIGEFTEGDLVRFLNEGCNPANGRRWSSNTIRSRRVALQAIFSWAHWKGIVASDPALHLRRLVKVQAKPVKQHIWLSAEEVDRLSLVPDLSTNAGLRDWVMVLLLVSTGLRVTEATKLTWRQINFHGRQIDVTADMAKGAKQSTVPMRPKLQAALEKWRAAYEEAVGPLGDQPVLVPITSQSGFGGGTAPRWGRRITSDGMRLVVGRMGADIGRPALLPHDLRRTYAGLLEANGMTLRQISKMLRHSNVAVTERYLEGNPFRNSEESDRDIF